MMLTEADRTIVLIHTHNPPSVPKEEKTDRGRSDDEIAEVLSLFGAGLMAKEVSDLTGIPLGTVKTYKRRAGLTESRK